MMSAMVNNISSARHICCKCVTRCCLTTQCVVKGILAGWVKMHGSIKSVICLPSSKPANTSSKNSLKKTS